MAPQEAVVRRLCAVRLRGLVRYEPSLALQRRLAALVREGALPSLALSLQHAPVVTLGKRGQREHLLATGEELRAKGIEVAESNRGGEVTYHGPGQVVMYPIVGVRAWRIGARRYVESLEDAVVGTLASYGVDARGRVPGATGVWVGDRKVAAVGVRISQGVSMHGVALNVDPDLSHFDTIVPCGFTDKTVTSLRRELPHAGAEVPAPSCLEVQRKLLRHFAGLVGATQADPLTETERGVVRDALRATLLTSKR